MKKYIAVFGVFMMCLCFSACSGPEAPRTSSQPNTSQEQSDIATDDTNSSGNTQTDTAESEAIVSSVAEETLEQKLKLIVNGQEISIKLYDTPAANALYDMLPLELTFEDFNGVEKISYLPDELPTEGEPDGCDPDIGDLCLYAPWGNLSIFYQDFRYSDSLIILGHIDEGMDIISSMDENTLVILEKIN